MKRVIFLLLILSAIKSLCQAADPIPLNYIPPTPEASNFIRYGEIPVDYSTGVPNINIPLYSLKYGDIEVPISISYHSSGNKVRDIAGPVGLGWSLNTGGMVSRTILGNYDDFSTTVEHATASEINSLTVLSKKQTLWLKSQSLAYRTESQSDRFNFFYPGNSGVFRYRYQNGIPNEPVTIPYQPLKIEKITSTADGPGFSFRITEKNGTQYIFEKWDKSTISQVDIYMDCHLSKIVSSNKSDTIYYNYEVSEQYQVWNYLNYYYIGCKSIEEQCVAASTNGCGDPLQGEGNDSQGGYSMNVTTHNTSLLTSIVANKTTVLFSYIEDRQDIRKKRLYEIDIKYNNSVLKKITLNNNSYLGIGTNNKRLKLNSLVVNDNAANPQQYTFQYNTTYNLPDYLKSYSNSYTYSEDYWGYYNNAQKNYNLPGEFMPAGTSSNYLGDRNPDETCMKAGVLEKITYPTGGWTEFVFEANRAQDVYEYNSNTLMGGLRIYQIKNYDNATDAPIIKTYKYGTGETGYAFNFVRITADMFQDWITHFEQSFVSGVGCETSMNAYSYSYLHVNEDPFLPLTLNNSCSVFYDEVTEYQGTTTTNAGKTIYSYENIFPDYSDLDDSYLQYAGPRYKSSFQWDCGNITPLIHSTKKYEQGATSPKETIYYDYSSFKDDTIHMGVNVIKKAVYYDYDQEIHETFESLGTGNYVYADTKAFTKVWLLTQEIRTIDGITTTINYYYDNTTHLLPTRQVATCSQTNSTIETRTRYPSDINSGVYSSMTTLNMLNYPIVKTSYYDGNITGGTLSTYKLEDGFYVQDSVLSLETTTSLSSITTFTGTTATIDSHYGKAELKYADYDTNGNILKIKSKDGTYTYYVWAYNSRYPVAKIVSPLSTIISATISDASLSNGTTLANIQADVAYLKSQLNSNYINNASYMVTLYTYKPLVGMTSETAPNGTSTYYIYDSFGRLSETRNSDGNLLQKYSYNYVNN